MAISSLLLAFFLTLHSFVVSSRTLQDSLVHHRELNDSRRNLGYLSSNTGNLIDDCLLSDHVQKHPQNLADCAQGFGKHAMGGKGGKFYVVTDAGDPHPVNVVYGTLRYAVIQNEPLWITFARNMVIELKEELIMNSHKTIDGRGHKIKLTGKSGITVQYVHNVIIHNIEITGMRPAGNVNVRSSPDHFGLRTESDGDAISIFGSNDVWVDHCTLSSCADGLVDVVMGSTGITISNNHFSNHNEVILLGHNDAYTKDKDMKVTVAYNYFGENLMQRMPRCRHGYIEVLNNAYLHGWEIYAIGGSARPTIVSETWGAINNPLVSQGNKFIAPNDDTKKEVTYHEDEPKSVWENYQWSTKDDLMVNGAFFTQSGDTARIQSMDAESYNQVEAITAKAGVM